MDEMFAGYGDAMGEAYDEMFDGDEPALAVHPAARRRCSTMSATEIARPGRRAPGQLPRPGRHLRHRRRGARVPARHPPAGDRDGPRGRAIDAGVQQRVKALEAFLDDVYDAGRVFDDGVIPRSVVTTSSHFHRAGGRDRAAQRRARARRGHRPDPRRPRRVPGARGQRPGAVRGLLRDDQPARDRGGAARDVRRAPDPSGRRLPAAAARRAARGGAGRGRPTRPSSC